MTKNTKGRSKAVNHRDPADSVEHSAARVHLLHLGSEEIPSQTDRAPSHEGSHGGTPWRARCADDAPCGNGIKLGTNHRKIPGETITMRLELKEHTCT